MFFIGILSAIEYFVMSALNLSSLPYDDLLIVFSVIVFINLIVQIGALKIVGIDIVSPLFFFLIFGYVFHFGQILMNNIYKYDYMNYLDVYMKRDLPVLMTTLKVSLNTLNAVFIGALMCTLFMRTSGNILNDLEIDEKKERRVCFQVGLAMFVISTPFRLIIDTTQMIAAIRFGYAGAIHALSMPGVFSALAGFWYSAIILMYVGKDNKKLLWFGVIYTTLTMLTGNRGHQITNILIMVMVYFHVEELKPKINKVVKYGILGYLLLMFIDMIMSFRSVGIRSFFSDFGYYFTQSLQVNIVFETIGSFGETLYTPFLVIKQMGENLNPFFMEGFIYSLGTLIPDIGGITSYTNVASNFAKMLDTSNAIGGSFIGDLYYNMKGLYWLGGLGVGYLLCKYSIKYKSCTQNRQYSKLIYYIPIFANVFWWVRDSIGNEMRPLVWQIVFSAIIVALFKEKNNSMV